MINPLWLLVVLTLVLCVFLVSKWFILGLVLFALLTAAANPPRR